MNSSILTSHELINYLSPLWTNWVGTQWKFSDLCANPFHVSGMVNAFCIDHCALENLTALAEFRKNMKNGLWPIKYLWFMLALIESYNFLYISSLTTAKMCKIIWTHYIKYEQNNFFFALNNQFRLFLS